MHSLNLLLILLLPLVGALVCAFLKGAAARNWALLVSVATLVLSIVVAFQANLYQTGDSLLWSNDGFSVVAGAFKFGLLLGADSLTIWLTILTTALTPLAILFSFGSIKNRETEYYAWLLVLLFSMIGVFLARDLLLFYVFFELTLVPMFFIIGIWGGAQRRQAAGKFFLFTFAGSVFTLAGVLYLGVQASSFGFTEVLQYVQTQATGQERFLLLLSLLAGFSVKVPLFPVHTWLPLAHTEAPTAGSVILAGVLLKLGTYGILKLAIPVGITGVDPDIVVGHFLWWDITTACFIKFLGVLCVIGILYGALVAWVQQDIKKLVAYSSVSHLGFCVLGMLAMNEIGIQGSILYMINHGISTGAMFLVIGMIYDRYHTRDINELSGLARIMPVMAFFFVFFVLSSIGLPGLNGFVSEFLTILGAFTSDRLGIAFGVPAALGIILGAVYMLHMTARVLFGPLKVPAHHDDHGHTGHGDHHGHHHAPAKNDLNAREVAVLIPLAIAAIVLGVLPRPMMKTLEGPIEQTISAPAASAAASVDHVSDINAQDVQLAARD